jgi:hypothetical protein
LSESKSRSGGGVLWTPLSVFLLSSIPPLVIYLIGLRGGLGVIDSGELAAVCHTLGIAHPPGYSLYTLAGRLWSLIPFGEVLTRLHVLSAFLTAAACGFAALALRETFRQVVASSRHRRLGVLLSVVGGWTWGMCPAVWPQAVENEVYGLHFLFLSMSLWLGLLLLRQGGSLKWRMLLAYVLGLGLSHHLSLAFAIPAIALAFFAQPIGRSSALVNTSRFFGRLWVAPALFFVLGVTLVIYLPVRSSLDPLLDWGDPANAARWLRHATGWQYRTWIGGELMGERTLAHVGHIPRNLGWVLPYTALVGIFVLWGRRLAVAGFWSLVFVVGTLWASSYDIKDIDSYYAAGDLACIAAGVAGLGWIFEKLIDHSRLRWGHHVLIPLAVAFLILSAGLRWNRSAANGPRLPDMYARTLLDGLPPNTLLVTQQWDLVISASYYIQLVEGTRQDVVVLDPELMRRSWYFPQLERRWPGFLDPVRQEVDDFLEDVALFEAGKPYDPASIEGKYQALQRRIVETYNGPLASTPEINPALFGNRPSTPHGLVWLWDWGGIVEGRGPLPDAEPFLEGGPRSEDLMTQLMRRNIGTYGLARAAVLERQGDAEAAATLREEAQRLLEMVQKLGGLRL